MDRSPGDQSGQQRCNPLSLNKSFANGASRFIFIAKHTHPVAVFQTNHTLFHRPSIFLVDCTCHAGGGSAGHGSDHSSAAASSKALIVIDEMGGGTVSVLLAVWAKQYAAQGTHDKSQNQVVIYHKMGLMDGTCSAGREISIVLATIKKW